MTPPEVAREIAAEDEAADRKHLHIVAWIGIGYLATLPITWWLGVRDPFYVTASAATSVTNIALQLGAMTSTRFMRAAWPFALAAALVGMCLTARMLTPFLFAPGLIAMALMSFAMSSQARERRVVVLCALLGISCVLGTYGAELVGILSPTTWVEGDRLILRSPIPGMARFPIIPTLCFYIVSLLASAASIAYVVSRDKHRAREQLAVQAWHLRQLL